MPDEQCPVCLNWNPWHHPYTLHAAWCPRYEEEPEEARQKNQKFAEAGGFYALGYPKDGVHVD